MNTMNAEQVMNTMNEEQVIHLYENVNFITHEMLIAAQRKNWEEFHHLGNRCNAEVDTLKQFDAVAKLTGPLLEKKFELIQTILGTDKAIRLITEPWMKQIDQLIQQTSASLKLENTYNTVAF
jgi:flagellar protein FliT